MAVTDIIAMVSLIFGALASIAGGVFTLIQWKKSQKIRRSEYIESITKRLYLNPNIAKAMYLVDYRQDWYDENFHGGSDTEMIIDALFSHLNYICYLHSKKLISDDEFSFMQYDVERACKNKSSQRYLKFLYHFSKTNNTTCSFNELITYMKTKVFDAHERQKFEIKDELEFAAQEKAFLCKNQSFYPEKPNSFHEKPGSYSYKDKSDRYVNCDDCENEHGCCKECKYYRFYENDRKRHSQY